MRRCYQLLAYNLLLAVSLANEEPLPPPVPVVDPQCGCYTLFLSDVDRQDKLCYEYTVSRNTGRGQRDCLKLRSLRLTSPTWSMCGQTATSINKALIDGEHSFKYNIRAVQDQQDIVSLVITSGTKKAEGIKKSLWETSDDGSIKFSLCFKPDTIRASMDWDSGTGLATYSFAGNKKKNRSPTSIECPVQNVLPKLCPRLRCGEYLSGHLQAGQLLNVAFDGPTVSDEFSIGAVAQTCSEDTTISTLVSAFEDGYDDEVYVEDDDGCGVTDGGSKLKMMTWRKVDGEAAPRSVHKLAVQNKGPKDGDFKLEIYCYGTPEIQPLPAADVAIRSSE